MRSSNVSDRLTIPVRDTLVWGPVAAVVIAAVTVLIDFWYGHVLWHRLVGFPSGDVALVWFSSATPADASSWVRFFPFDELYDLALHFAMLAVALAGALMFAAGARKALRESEPILS
jgi:hypothetical protein